MKKLISILAITSTAVLSFQCEKELTVDLPESPSKLAVSAFLHPDSTVEAKISNSLSILDNGELTAVDGATVGLYENGVFIENLTQDGEAYTGNHEVIVGREYKLEVSKAGFETVHSTSKLPTPISIINIDSSSTFTPDGGDMIELNISFQDNGAEENFYVLQMYTTGQEYITDQFGEVIDSMPFSEDIYFTSNDVVFDNMSQDYWTQMATFQDDLFNGQQKSVQVMLSSYFFMEDQGWWGNQRKNEAVKIRLVNASKEFYFYSTSLDRYQWNNGDPFATPVQVYTNVENGFGIFAGYAYDEFVMEL